MRKIKQFFCYVRALIQYEYAKALCDRQYAKKGHRHFVMIGEDDKLIIVSRKEFRAYKHRGQIARTAKIEHLLEDCVYHTASRYGNFRPNPHTMEARRKGWIRYTVKRLMK